MSSLIALSNICTRTWYGVPDEELLEVPEAEVGDLGHGVGPGADHDVADLEVSVHDGAAQVVKVGQALGYACKK